MARFPVEFNELRSIVISTNIAFIHQSMSIRLASTSYLLSHCLNKRISETVMLTASEINGLCVIRYVCMNIHYDRAA